MNGNLVRHQGIISELKGNVASVKLINISACSACHAKAACSVSETDNKTVEVPFTSGMSKGDRVNILLDESLGVKALLFGYVYPFLVMLTGLFISWTFTENETLSGIIALLALPPYYLGLSLFRRKLKRTFSFIIEKIEA